MMTSSSSSPSSSPSSEGRCLREETAMHKFEHLPLLRPPPPPPATCRCRKHHCHRHHSHPFPPPPIHGCHHFTPLSDRHPPPHCPHRHHHKKRHHVLKPPKPSKKIHKLHHKLMKAYVKLHKCPYHGGRHHHTPFPSPKDGMFSTHIGHQHPPGCCLHGMGKGRFSTEKQCPLHDMGIPHEDCPHCHSPHHKTCGTRPLIQSEIVREEVVPENMMTDEAPAEPPIANVAVPLDSNRTLAEESVPVIPAP